MKDPLQLEQTPAEILGVGRGANRAEIERAFAAALARRVPPNTAKNARDALLLHPVRRAWYDVLTYDDEVLGRLNPAPQAEAAALQRPRRAATAKAWEQQLRRRFPDPGMVHSLAVFWYWWGVYEESRLQALMAALGTRSAPVPGEAPRQTLLKAVRKAEGVKCDPSRAAACSDGDCPWREDCLSSAPPPKEIWERVIGYWTMLAVDPEFGKDSYGLADGDVAALRQQLKATLRNTLLDLPGRYDQHQAWSDQYRPLESALTAELDSAQALYDVGMRTPVGRVACGALVLARMEMLEVARAKVEAALKNRPESRSLRRLRDMLMPHSAVAMLVAQRKPEAALAAIAELPADQRETREVYALQAQAFHLRAQQKASLDEMEAALAAWKSGLEAAGEAGSEHLASEMKSELVSTCHSKAAAMGDRRRDDAIDLLEKADALVPDEKLRLSLAALLTRRGVRTFVQAQERLGRERDLTPGIIADFEAGYKDLERAAELGSREAAEQLRAARGFLAGALTAHGIAAINRAQEQAKEEGEISEEVIAAMRAGLRDLERAEQLGSTKAAEQVRAARSVIAQAELLRRGLGGRLEQLREEAGRSKPTRPKPERRQVKSARPSVLLPWFKALFYLLFLIGVAYLGWRGGRALWASGGWLRVVAVLVWWLTVGWVLSILGAILRLFR